MYNSILSKINKHLRNDRIRLLPTDIFYPRIEKVVSGYYLELWFTTNGCSFDKNGSCTMCNYGIGYKIKNNIIIDNLKNYLNSLDINITELMISPSGSLWDKNEVEPELLEEIYKLASDENIELFMIETRIDTITEKKLHHFRKSFPSKRLAIEVGLESNNDFVLKYLINKNLSINKSELKLKNLKIYNIELYINISLGNAFFNEKESIEDTIKSINWSFQHGANKVVVFPIHIKPNTFINWLYQNNFYTPVSLWSLIEVLNSVDKDLLKNIEIAWYKSYYTSDDKMVMSPTTCVKCRNTVISLLDEYRATCSYEILQKFNKIDCVCKIQWKNNLLINNDDLLDRTINIYKKASNDILNEDLDNSFIENMRDDYVVKFLQK